MHKFFSNNNVKEVISDCIKLIMKFDFNDTYEEQRNGFIMFVLQSMINNENEWDENTQFNIKVISDQFLTALSKEREVLSSKEHLDFIFILVFRFYSECQLYINFEAMDNYMSMRDFAKNNMNNFSDRLAGQINYTLHDMSSSVLKFLLSGHDFSTFRDFIRVKEEAAKLKGQWESEINEQIEKVTKLKDTLEEQENAYNFVGLYSGFDSLGKIKEKQLKWAKIFLLGLGVLLPIIVGGSFWHLLGIEGKVTTPYDLLTLIPTATLSLILIYYFRISLSNYNSIRAQIMQIDLRKNLCQFIQQYAKYSSELSKNDPGLLSKFEEVIFSNIMVSEDKIPSTFDGVEQIATLINAVKSKGK